MLEMWYVALPTSGSLPDCSNGGPRSKMALPQGVLGLNQGHTYKNIKKSSSSDPLGSLLEILNVVLPNGPLTNCSNEGPRVPNGSTPEGFMV